MKNIVKTVTYIVLVLLSISNTALSQPFSPGNIVITTGRTGGPYTLLEYTLGGGLIQEIPISNPENTSRNTTRFIYDIVVDDYGRAHVINTSSTAPTYVSTYDPILDQWSHVEIANTSGQGVLSINNNIIYTRLQSIDVSNWKVTDIFIPPNGVRMIASGLDGLLYGSIASVPTSNIKQLDPATNIVTKDIIAIDTYSRDTRMDIRDLAITNNGEIYVAEWDGRIIKFNSNGDALDFITAPVSSLNDINININGILISGSRFGDIVVTDALLNSITSFNVSSYQTYVAHVPITGINPDRDNDDIFNFNDNCPDTYNPNQTNQDLDEFGDICDSYPLISDNLSACLSDSVNKDTEIHLLAQINTELFSDNEFLRLQLADNDNDDVIDTYDFCNDSQLTEVDSNGCDINQFCATFSSRKFCNSADWNNDEPLHARDCKWRKKQCAVREITKGSKGS